MLAAALVVAGGWFVSEYNGAALLSFVSILIGYLGFLGLASSITVLIIDGINKLKKGKTPSKSGELSEYAPGADGIR